MRQTSRAAALLLALDSAQALTTTVQKKALQQYNGSVLSTQFGQPGGYYNLPAGALASHTAPYNSCPGYIWNWPITAGTYASVAANCLATNWTTRVWWPALTPQLATASDIIVSPAYAAQMTGGSLCVVCVQKNGVWCSRTYSFSIASGTTYQTNSATATVPNVNIIGSAGQLWTAGGTKDNGSCCETRAVFAQVAQNLPTPADVVTPAGSASKAGAVLSLNAYTCAAFKNVQTSGPLATLDVWSFDSAAVAVKNTWWCTNGLYHLITSSGNQYDNFIQTIPDTANQRFELALVGCPQLVTICKYASVDLETATGASNPYVQSINTMTAQDKCTWVVSSKSYPPAFAMGKGASTPAAATIGLLATSAFTVHHMEYNSEQLAVQADNNYITDTAALDYTSKTPQFTMPYGTYAKQRTWYGAGTGITATSNWSSPYQNFVTLANQANLKSVQTWGSVANFVSSVAGTDYTATSTATYDSRQVRYVPAQVAVNDNAMGVGVASAYNTNLTSYNTAKTMWNNYVAILTKNAKVDAFAAAFAPPKAPTVPPLPSKPWTPSVSGTMYKMSAANLAAFFVTPSTVITSTVQPTTGQFWLNDESVSLATGGGWGSWTSAVLTYRDDWGKVFGTIGYELTTGSGNTWAAKAQVYKQAWQCNALTIVAPVSPSVIPAPSATTACPLKYTATTSAATTATVTANTTVFFYMAVSIWTTKQTGSTEEKMAVACTGANISCFQISFSRGSWAALNAVAAPAGMAAATAADSLSGVVGAQALAASAAAALAAAALY